ncbi:MAG: hypothetical protein ABI870_15560 [Rhodanobacter sp.]
MAASLPHGAERGKREIRMHRGDGIVESRLAIAAAKDRIGHRMNAAAKLA